MVSTHSSRRSVPTVSAAVAFAALVLQFAVVFGATASAHSFSIGSGGIAASGADSIIASTRTLNAHSLGMVNYLKQRANGTSARGRLFEMRGNRNKWVWMERGVRRGEFTVSHRDQWTVNLVGQNVYINIDVHHDVITVYTNGVRNTGTISVTGKHYTRN